MKSEEKYIKSEFHYANLGSSRNSSFKKSASGSRDLFKTATSGENEQISSTGCIKRRCISVPSIKLLQDYHKCENCSGNGCPTLNLYLQ